MKSFMLPILLLALVGVLSAVSPPTPAFCEGLDCPLYKMYFEDNSTGIEYRYYQPAVSARTKVDSISYEDAVHTGFDRLFQYISGANDQNITIEMTTPVNTQIIYPQGPFCETTFIISFYCPFIYQSPTNPPPKPTDPTVYIETVPEAKRAVYGFPGYLEHWSAWVQPSQYLYGYLDENNMEYDSTYECTNVYNSPFQPIKRHNEVWVTLK